MAGFFENIKKLLLYSETPQKEGFILKEGPKEGYSDKKSGNEKNKGKDEKEGKKKREQGDETKSDFPFKKPVSVGSDNGEKERTRSKDVKEVSEHSNREERSGGIRGEDPEISKDIDDSLAHMKKVFSVPINSDIIIREFEIVVKKELIKAFIIFIDGMTDRMVINVDILQPLMLLSNIEIENRDKDIIGYVKNHILPQNQLKVVSKYKEVIDEINFGGCGIFIDGVDQAFAADVKGWEHRGVERPNTELVIRGPQEGFSELLRANTAMIRKILKDSDLIIESIEIGSRNKTPCCLLYIRDITNESLVNEVRRRLKSIKVDYLLDSGELEQFIEDRTFLPSPQIIATERPDRTASHLTEGKVAVIVNGSPYSLVMPATGIELMHSPEDSYVRFPFGSFMRIFRYIGLFLTLLLPGLYIAITNYHQEMIPTDLLIAIEASREKVPFPSVVEIMIMEISFELIREAGIRIPGPIGPTLGIIGALILGQAAVAANIVSPILIIIVAVTGIGSFAIPNFSLALSFRMLRFAYIILGAVAGFLGITTGIFLHGLMLANTKSFGVPLLAPFGPITKNLINDEVARFPIWKQEKRPDFLNTKDEEKQPEISRGWVEEDSNKK